jgi:uncharacterized protein
MLCLAAWPMVIVAADAPKPAPDPDTDDLTASAPAAPDPAESTYWEAMKRFRTGKPDDMKKGRELLEQAADLEFTHAQNTLGLCLLAGRNGYGKNERKAATLFQLAAARNNAFAALNLGLCYYNGTGVRKDLKLAVQWLTVAAADNANYASPKPPDDFFAASAPSADATLSGALPVDPADSSRATAHFALGEICTADKDLAAAQDHYVKAATMGPAGRAGIFQAAIKAATGFAFGNGVPRDLGRANEMLDLSKKLSRRLGMVYAQGLVEQKLLDDFAQADLEEQFSTESEKLQHQLQFNIAGSFADPKSKTYDAKEAAKWYELAADGGEAWAMLNLAFLYHEGRLGTPDPAKAFTYFKMASEKGHHLLGHANTALCYLYGLGTPKDPAKAAEIFAAHRDEDIVCYLGTIGQAPAGIINYDDEVELNKTWAKQKKDPQANYLLGLRYLRGWGVKADNDDAIACFKRGAKANHGASLAALGELYEGDANSGRANWSTVIAQATECYKKGAELGNIDATASLARFYGEGIGVAKDEDKAIALYEKCLKQNPKLDAVHNNLAVIYEARYARALRGREDLAANRAKMLEHFTEADRLGSAIAARNLGFLYYERALGAPNYEKAYGYFTKAAEGGYADARRILGQMHEQGQGVPVTYREAAYHYRLAALAGDRIALVRLCDFYLTGKGVSRDFDRASYWLVLLAQKGDFRAVMALGDLALRKGEYPGALKLFKQLIDLENPMLQGYGYEHLSWMYEHGWGVTASPSKAKRYHDKAVALNYGEAIHMSAMALVKQGKKTEAVPLLEKAASSVPAASYTLGYFYLSGDVVPRDPVKGWSLIKRAANGGSTDAQVALAAAALKNVAGAPSLDEAIRWAEMAESAGSPKAKTIREQLEAKRSN